MADISLTASMRSNLLSLQSTQSLMDMTQERLSTGKKVNSAIDNPSSYYTAQSLTNRANDLSALLDSMGQGIQTIKAANEGIEAITAFAEQAKAVASSARDVASIYDKYAIGSADITEGVTANFYVDSRDDMSKVTIDLAGNDDVAEFKLFYGNGKEALISGTGTANQGEVQEAVVADLQAQGFTVTQAGTQITITAADGSDISWVNTQTDPGDGQVTAVDAEAVEVTLAEATTGRTAATIAAEINGKANLVATSEGMSVEITAPDREFRIFAADETNQEIIDELELSGSRAKGDPDVVSTDRIKYAEQFNEILSQIDTLAKDSGYKGINLLQEEDLTVIFNEDRSSNLEVKGVDASSKGLGLEAAQGDWQRNVDIDKAISQVETAVSRLRSMASEFGNNYSIVQSREDFTNNLINVLEEGSDKLTLADMNEESANMLALQTRQQLAINSLSLASQAAQSVLQLF